MVLLAGIDRWQGGVDWGNASYYDYDGNYTSDDEYLLKRVLSKCLPAGIYRGQRGVDWCNASCYYYDYL